jgi:metal-responsive CopG/Arc/MetJ family transcriptional regulator
MARTTSILTISLPPEMVEKVNEFMKKEKRTRSELFREALRKYFEQQELREIVRYGMRKAREKGMSEDQVEDIIDVERKGSHSQRKGF